MVHHSQVLERIFSHHVQGSTSVNIVQLILRLFDPFGLECLRFFDRRVVLKEFCFCARLRKPFLSRGALCGVSTLCVVLDLIDTVSNERRNPPCLESWDSCLAILVFG